MQDETEIGRGEGPDHRAPVDDPGDPLESLRELDCVDCRVNRRKRAQHAFDFHAALERRVGLRVERLGLRHSTGHPEHDHGVGRSDAARRTHDLRLTPDEGRKRGSGGRSHEATACDATADVRLFARHKHLAHR